MMSRSGPDHSAHDVQAAGLTVKRRPTAKAASVGVTRTKLAVEEDLGWLFREQPTEDYGIDAHIEIVDGEDVTGRLLALQIKSGKKYFSSPVEEGWWFRPDGQHVDYWTRHSLPVVVVLVQPETKVCHWEFVNGHTLQRTRTGGWKVFVRKANVLDASAIAALTEAATGDPYSLRIWELVLARPWMEMLDDGQRLVIDIEESVNKTSGRGAITIGIDHEDGRDPESLLTWGVLLMGHSYAEVVPRLFAWAHVALHEETYEEADRSADEAECMVEDNEGDVFFREEYGEWASTLPGGLRPYENVSGEVDMWRLELSLNDVGKAFLVVDGFANDGLPQLTP